MCDFSVVIPAYNAEKYIKETVDSVLSQTHASFECIVVNDGSTDGTMDVLKQYTDPRVILLTIKNSVGPSQPRNEGIKISKGKYILMTDADDPLLPHKMSEYYDVFNTCPEADAVFSDFSFIDERSQLLKESFLADYNDFRKIMSPVGANVFKMDMTQMLRELIKANFIGISSVCFKRELATHGAVFDEAMHASEDVLAWSRLTQYAQFFFLNKIMHQYRIHAASVSNANVEKFLKYKIAVLEKISKFSYKGDEKVALKNKMDEYYFSLGYQYFKRKMQPQARESYACISNYFPRAKLKWAIVKSYIAQLLRV